MKNVKMILLAALVLLSGQFVVAMDDSGGIGDGEDNQCPVCLMPYDDVRQRVFPAAQIQNPSCCGHSVCRECFVEMQNYSKQPSSRQLMCPTCRSLWTSSPESLSHDVFESLDAYAGGYASGPSGSPVHARHLVHSAVAGYGQVGEEDSQLQSAIAASLREAQEEDALKLGCLISLGFPHDVDLSLAGLRDCDLRKIINDTELSRKYLELVAATEAQRQEAMRQASLVTRYAGGGAGSGAAAVSARMPVIPPVVPTPVEGPASGARAAGERMSGAGGHTDSDDEVLLSLIRSALDNHSDDSAFDKLNGLVGTYGWEKIKLLWRANTEGELLEKLIAEERDGLVTNIVSAAWFK